MDNTKLSLPANEFAHIRGIIWDLDNTLYRFDEAFVHACNIAAARTVCDLGYETDFAKALTLAEQSYIQHGYIAVSFLEHYEMSYEEYHFKFHDTLDEKIIKCNMNMKEELKRLNMPYVIITHASRNWARKITAHLGMAEFFPEERIIAIEDVDFVGKARSENCFKMACDIIGMQPHELLMVEDTVRNLKIPKEMGFTTVLVHHGRTFDEEFDFVDYEFADTLSLSRAIA